MFTSRRDNMRKSSEKTSKASVIVTFGVLLLVGLINSASYAAVTLILIMAVTAAIVFAAIFAGKKLAAKRSAFYNKGFAYTTHENHQPRKYDPEMVRNRDNIRRLEQLDSFLKNGIIDKREYAVLKKKYEKYTNL